MRSTLCILYIVTIATIASAASLPFAKGSKSLAHGSVSIDSGFTEIAGNLPTLVFQGSRPYLITADIYVPAGKKVTIQPGAVFLFRNFTGLHVEGVLTVAGTKEQPVVFTSENDKEYNGTSTIDAAPYDWNGITIHEDAVGTKIVFGAVLYSVYGVNALTKFIKLDPCLFLHNGRSNFSVLGTEQSVGTEPVIYGLALHDSLAASSTMNNTDFIKDPKAPVRSISRSAGFAVGAVGLISGVIMSVRFAESSRKFTEASSLGIDNLSQNSSDVWIDRRARKNSDALLMLLGYGAAVAGSGLVYWTFTF